MSTRLQEALDEARRRQEARVSSYRAVDVVVDPSALAAPGAEASSAPARALGSLADQLQSILRLHSLATLAVPKEASHPSSVAPSFPFAPSSASSPSAHASSASASSPSSSVSIPGAPVRALRDRDVEADVVCSTGRSEPTRPPRILWVRPAAVNRAGTLFRRDVWRQLLRTVAAPPTSALALRNPFQDDDDVASLDAHRATVDGPATRRNEALLDSITLLGPDSLVLRVRASERRFFASSSAHPPDSLVDWGGVWVQSRDWSFAAIRFEPVPAAMDVPGFVATLASPVRPRHPIVAAGRLRFQSLMHSGPENEGVRRGARVRTWGRARLSPELLRGAVVLARRLRDVQTRPADLFDVSLAATLPSATTSTHIAPPPTTASSVASSASSEAGRSTAVDARPGPALRPKGSRSSIVQPNPGPTLGAKPSGAAPPRTPGPESVVPHSATPHHTFPWEGVPGRDGSASSDGFHLPAITPARTREAGSGFPASGAMATPMGGSRARFPSSSGMRAGTSEAAPSTELGPGAFLSTPVPVLGEGVVPGRGRFPSAAESGRSTHFVGRLAPLTHGGASSRRGESSAEDAPERASGTGEFDLDHGRASRNVDDKGRDARDDDRHAVVLQLENLLDSAASLPSSGRDEDDDASGAPTRRHATPPAEAGVPRLHPGPPPSGPPLIPKPPPLPAGSAHDHSLPSGHGPDERGDAAGNAGTTGTTGNAGGGAVFRRGGRTLRPAGPPSSVDPTTPPRTRGLDPATTAEGGANGVVPSGFRGVGDIRTPEPTPTRPAPPETGRAPLSEMHGAAFRRHRVREPESARHEPSVLERSGLDDGRRARTTAESEGDEGDEAGGSRVLDLTRQPAFTPEPPARVLDASTLDQTMTPSRLLLDLSAADHTELQLQTDFAAEPLDVSVLHGLRPGDAGSDEDEQDGGREDRGAEVTEGGRLGSLQPGATGGVFVTPARARGIQGSEGSPGAVFTPAPLDRAHLFSP